MKTERLFFGLELPASVQQLIAKSLPGKGRGVSVVALGNFHVTLRFIGDVETDERERLVESMREVAVAPFTLRLEGGGFFPPRGPLKVVWLGVGSGHPNLFQLRQQMDDRLLQLGIPCELREFLPHVTVARIRPGGEGSGRSLARALAAFDGPVFSVDRFTLFESQREIGGLRYEPVEHFDLRGRAQ